MSKKMLLPDFFPLVLWLRGDFFCSCCSFFFAAQISAQIFIYPRLYSSRSVRGQEQQQNLISCSNFWSRFFVVVVAYMFVYSSHLAHFRRLNTLLVLNVLLRCPDNGRKVERLHILHDFLTQACCHLADFITNFRPLRTGQLLHCTDRQADMHRQTEEVQFWDNLDVLCCCPSIKKICLHSARILIASSARGLIHQFGAKRLMVAQKRTLFHFVKCVTFALAHT